MPAGQTPHTVVLFAHNDLVDKVQPGDRVHITGEGLHHLTSDVVPAQTVGCLLLLSKITNERL